MARAPRHFFRSVSSHGSAWFPRNYRQQQRSKETHPKRQQHAIKALPTVEPKNILGALTSMFSDPSPNYRVLSSPNEEDLISNDNLIISDTATDNRDYSDGVVDLPQTKQNERTTHRGKSNRMLYPDPAADLLKFSAITSAYNAKGIVPQPENDRGILMNDQLFPARSLLPGNKVYNSYQQFNPGQFQENSPEWQMAMLHYLIDMKDHGHKIQEVSVNKVTFKDSFFVMY